jgi:hypothetical protein
MRLITETAERRRTGMLSRMPTWIGRRQRELSDRLHAAGDECARQHGWQVAKSTGRLGFGARSYRDPRFGDRRWQPGHQQTEPPTIGWAEASNYEAVRAPGE